MADPTPSKDQERTDNSPTSGLWAKLKRPTNLYILKRSKMTQIHITDFAVFTKMVNVHVNTILKHDPGQKLTDWYSLWQQWLDDNLMETTTLHMVSVIIEFPTKTNKSVARFILEHLPVLDRYLNITGVTRDNDPLVDIRAPYLLNTVTGTKPQSSYSEQLEDNPYAILGNLNEEEADDLNKEADLDETALGPPIEEIDHEDLQTQDEQIKNPDPAETT